MLIAQSIDGTPISILPRLANRHGLITGATGTGKTVTLQRLAEQFSLKGVPVFLADVKGDLSGIAAAGVTSEKLSARLEKLKMTDHCFQAFPTDFWDVYAQSGHPVRTTLSEVGPALLARMMNLNDTQASVLQILFKIADDAGLLLLDMKDLTALLQLVQENLEKFKPQYGHLSPASLGTIQRSLLSLETQGGKGFFGEPGFNVQDLLQTDPQGRGYVNILSSEKLLLQPVLYSTFLLWMLSELFETLPEVGDLDKPKLIFFFDEAHLLFKDAPKALVEKIEQVVRLIRSKGVGVYFVTQMPSDIPVTILGQLSHRVQHALRAFTPADRKSVVAAAESMRPNPKFKTEDVITELGVGEALVSVLDEAGAPTVVERCWILPPASRIGPLTPAERSQVLNQSPVAGFYEKSVDRESAFEIILKQKQGATNSPASESTAGSAAGSAPEPFWKTESTPTAAGQTETPSVLNEILFGSTGPRGGRRAGLIEKAATSAARTVASSVGREIVRGILGSLMGGSSPRRGRR